MIELLRNPFSTDSSEHQSKQFYHHFKTERTHFLQLITGIAHQPEGQAYGTLLLQRVLVLYFLQAQGLLDNNPRYLYHHLQSHQQSTGGNHFYREWLLPLFTLLYTGHTACVYASGRFGHIPHLGHPLFQPHALESAEPLPDIPNEAFARLFTFLDMYDWHLSADPVLHIHPERYRQSTHVLAYIFEQLSNQKQTGTYYTQEDVALYIASHTIIPALLTRVIRDYPDFQTAAASTWHLLQTQPERYIPFALRSPLPLPEEDEREYQERQKRYQHLCTRMRTGQLHSIAALTTENIDVQQFVHDLLLTTQDTALLTCFYSHLKRLTILDPTCGSGAFLFASLNILRPIYHLCLQRLLDDPQGTNHSILQQIGNVPSREYFILTTIICHNLYGVELQAPAVDLCTLQLYLTLLSEVQQIQDVPAFSALEHHIRVGNALVQQATQNNEHNQTFHWETAFSEVQASGGFAVIIGNPPYLEYSKVRQEYTIAGYEARSCGNLYAAIIERSLQLCHPEDSYLGLIIPISICGSGRFDTLRQALRATTRTLWLASFEIFPCRLFANAFQRLSILIARHQSHRTGIKTSNQPTAQEECQLYVTRIHRWYAAERAHLLQLLNYTHATNLAIQQIGQPAQQVFPKLASIRHEQILQVVQQAACHEHLTDLLCKETTPHFVYYQEATNYWTKAVCHIPFYKKNGVVMRPPHGRMLFFDNERSARVVMALLNSSLFYLWFATYSDGFHLSHTLVQNFPLPHTLLDLPQLFSLAQELENDIARNARIGTRNTRTNTAGTGHLIELAEFYMRHSKAILDQIDHVLANFYGFSPDDEDFIINYDRKHRIAKKRTSKRHTKDDCNK